MSDGPRYNPGWDDDIPTTRMKFLQRMGEYDLWWDRNEQCYTVVQDPFTSKNSHNYTDYKTFEKDEQTCLIEPEDNDVILDPYHMCLLYAAHAEINGE